MRIRVGLTVLLAGTVTLVCGGRAWAQGSLTPPGTPAPVMCTLDQVYGRLAIVESNILAAVHAAAPVPRTGQTDSVAAGDDAALSKGVPWPVPRFTDNGNGTVRDNLTGLTWLKNANPCGTKNWSSALAYCNSLSNGVAGLSDGSVSGSWRLPNVRELQSLVDFKNTNPALSAGHPFTNVQLDAYWSSTSSGDFPLSNSWWVEMHYGQILGVGKTDLHFVWPVRGGQ